MPETISSLQNEKVKLARALQNQAKARRKEDKIVLEGMRLVRDALMQGHKPDFLLVTSEAPFLADYDVEPIAVSNDVMRHISDTQQPQGILGVFPMPHSPLPTNMSHILVLDSIRDPGNLGTILRTAGAAGIEAVLLSPTCVDPYNPKALRSGMGAHFRLSVKEAGWSEIERCCYNTHIFLADSQGDQRYDEADWSGDWSIIIGGEAHGAGTEASELAHTRVCIPMAAKTESLNAAVAAGILMFEAIRGTGT